MPGFGDVVKKAFYLGVGVASYAGEKAGHTLKDLQEQTQVVVNELVARGEMTAEEAQRLVNEMVSRAQTSMVEEDAAKAEPRRIEILDDEPSSSQPPAPTDADPTAALRQQVAALRQELDALQRKASNH
jgi:polyhydroxyalkanoate synthesis regulator phasin